KAKESGPKTRESGPRVMEKSRAIFFVVLFTSLGLIAGFSGGFLLSNYLNTEEFNKIKGASKPAGRPGAGDEQGGGGNPMSDVMAQLERLKQQAAKDPKDIRSRKALAAMYSRVGKMDQAIEWYKQIMAIDPNDNDTRSEMAMAYLRNAETDKAEAELQKS